MSLQEEGDVILITDK